MDRLKEKYTKEVVPELTKKFGYTNVMQLPKLEKVIINMGVGEAVGNPKALEAAVSDLTIISGQKPIVTRAKKSIATWKIREGMAIGAKVTLRGSRMYQFLERPRQLFCRSQGTADFPGNRLRQDRQDSRNERCHRNDGENGRRSSRTAAVDGNAVRRLIRS